MASVITPNLASKIFSRDLRLKASVVGARRFIRVKIALISPLAVPVAVALSLHPGQREIQLW